MPFKPEPGDALDFADMVYRVAEHPAAPGMAHSLKGRAGHVYRLDTESGDQFALKVFDTHTRDPAHVVLASRLSSLANVPGLAACRQKVLSPRRNRTLLQCEPELLYAVIMPWIQGPTWAELVIEQHALVPDESLDLARALTDVLQGLEERGLAHCDISGSNVLLPGLTETYGAGSLVELVDVDQFYGRILDRPAELPAGSPGYAHRTSAQGQWGPRADRFGGAVLIAEMLGWCNPQICKTTTDESYFTPAELQDPNCERFALLMSVLRVQWGTALADLFDRAWRSPSLDECPSFGEWLLALPNDARMPVEIGDDGLDPETIPSQGDDMYHRSLEARRIPRPPRRVSLPERILGAVRRKSVVYATVAVLIVVVLVVGLNAFLSRSSPPPRATPPTFGTNGATPTVSATPTANLFLVPTAVPRAP